MTFALGQEDVFEVGVLKQVINAENPKFQGRFGEIEYLGSVRAL